jgi:hypothetical protein
MSRDRYVAAEAATHKAYPVRLVSGDGRGYNGGTLSELVPER